MSDTVLVCRAPCDALRGAVADLIGYAEGAVPMHSVEAAPLVFPLIFSIGAPWRIALGEGAPRSWPVGFAAGLFAGPVYIRSPGWTECVQVNLTPAGAVRLFGGAVTELAGRMVDLDLLPGFGGTAMRLRQRLGETSDWAVRFDMVEAFLAPLLVHEPSAQVSAAWNGLARGLPVAEVARDIGWSNRYLTQRFRAETGLAPVSVARMLRFRRALALAQCGAAPGWSAIAAETGYSDQAHLIREFRYFSGQTPTAWARDFAASERLRRDA